MKPEDVRREVADAARSVLLLVIDVVDQRKSGVDLESVNKNIEVEVKKIEDRAVENILNIGAKR